MRVFALLGFLVFANALCPSAPRPVTASLQMCCNRLVVTFDYPVAPQSKCDKIFSNDTLASIGYTNDDLNNYRGPKCIWTDVSSLSVWLSFNTSVKVGNVLNFLPNSTVCSDAPYSVQKNITRLAITGSSVIPDALSVQFTRPIMSQVTACETLSLVAWAFLGTGGRSLNWKWTIAPSANGTLATAISAANSSNLLVPGSIFPQGVSFTITATATNFIGVSSSASTTTLRVAGIPKTLAALDRPPGTFPWSLPAGGYFPVSANLRIPGIEEVSCAAPPANFDRKARVQWQASPSNVAHPPLTSATIFADTTGATGPSISLSFTATTNSGITTDASPAIAIGPAVTSFSNGRAWFAGASRLSILAGSPLLLEGRASFEYDSVTWTCVGSFSVCNSFTSPASRFLSLPQGLSPSASVASITVHFWKNLQEINATAIVDVLPTPGAIIGIFIGDNTMKPSVGYQSDIILSAAVSSDLLGTDKFADGGTEWVWRVSGANISLTNLNRLPYVLLPANSMSAGQRFTISATSATGAFSQIQMEFDLGPSPAPCWVSPNGAGVAASIFQLICESWQDETDNFPLAYQWRVRFIDSVPEASSPISRPLFSPMTYSVLPVGNKGFFQLMMSVTVTNIFGAATTSVDVRNETVRPLNVLNESTATGISADFQTQLTGVLSRGDDFLSVLSVNAFAIEIKRLHDANNDDYFTVVPPRAKVSMLETLADIVTNYPGVVWDTTFLSAAMNALAMLVDAAVGDRRDPEAARLQPDNYLSRSRSADLVFSLSSTIATAYSPIVPRMDTPLFARELVYSIGRAIFDKTDALSLISGNRTAPTVVTALVRTAVNLLQPIANALLRTAILYQPIQEVNDHIGISTRRVFPQEFSSGFVVTIETRTGARVSIPLTDNNTKVLESKMCPACRPLRTAGLPLFAATFSDGADPTGLISNSIFNRLAPVVYLRLMMYAADNSTVILNTTTLPDAIIFSFTLASPTCCDSSGWFTLNWGKFFAPPQCPQGNPLNPRVRLTQCSNVACRVEVKRNNTWGTACDDSFFDLNAAVVCREMGLFGGKATRAFGTTLDPPSLPILLHNALCVGNESSVLDCPVYNSDHPPVCTHTEDVGVCCRRTVTDLATGTSAAISAARRFKSKPVRTRENSVGFSAELHPVLESCAQWVNNSWSAKGCIVIDVAGPRVNCSCYLNPEIVALMSVDRKFQMGAETSSGNFVDMRLKALGRNVRPTLDYAIGFAVVLFGLNLVSISSYAVCRRRFAKDPISVISRTVQPPGLHPARRFGWIIYHRHIYVSAFFAPAWKRLSRPTRMLLLTYSLSLNALGVVLMYIATAHPSPRRIDVPSVVPVSIVSIVVISPIVTLTASLLSYASSPFPLSRRKKSAKVAPETPKENVSESETPLTAPAPQPTQSPQIPQATRGPPNPKYAVKISKPSIEIPISPAKSSGKTPSKFSVKSSPKISRTPTDALTPKNFRSPKGGGPPSPLMLSPLRMRAASFSRSVSNLFSLGRSPKNRQDLELVNVGEETDGEGEIGKRYKSAADFWVEKRREKENKRGEWRRKRDEALQTSGANVEEKPQDNFYNFSRGLIGSSKMKNLLQWKVQERRSDRPRILVSLFLRWIEHSRLKTDKINPAGAYVAMGLWVHLFVVGAAGLAIFVSWTFATSFETYQHPGVLACWVFACLLDMIILDPIKCLVSESLSLWARRVRANPFLPRSEHDEISDKDAEAIQKILFRNGKEERAFSLPSKFQNMKWQHPKENKVQHATWLTSNPRELAKLDAAEVVELSKILKEKRLGEVLVWDGRTEKFKKPSEIDV